MKHWTAKLLVVIGALMVLMITWMCIFESVTGWTIIYKNEIMSVNLGLFITSGVIYFLYDIFNYKP